MSKKCLGCGITLQDSSLLNAGYTTNINNDYCIRCFKMRNYGEYEFVSTSNDEYEKILNKINRKNSLVLYVVDILSVPENLNKVREILKKNKIILILNKRDALPLSIKAEKLIEYFKEQYEDFIDIILISSYKNYNLDNLMKSIKKYKNSEEIYIIGNTNAGKSTLINKIIDNYGIEEPRLTISPMLGTTLKEIVVPMKDYNLIDTPGFVNPGNILNYVSNEYIKKISPYKQIKPKTYQIRSGESLVIGDFLKIEYLEGEKNSFTLFISNELKVKRVYSKRNKTLSDEATRNFTLKYHEDIVIEGLGFIKTVLPGNIKIFINKDVNIFIRKALI